LKNESTYAKKFKSLFNRLKKKYSAEPHEPFEPVTHLVVSMLQWNSTREAALAAHDRLMQELVDNNDLRVCHPHEIVEMIGRDYPQVEERAARLREILQEIFLREHATSLQSLEDKPKKEVRAYLESLPGMPSCVAAEVTLLCFGGHAFPVEERLLALLREEKVVDPEATLSVVQSFLERQIKAGTAVHAHAVLCRWVEASFALRRSRKKRSKTSGSGGRAAKKAVAGKKA